MSEPLRCPANYFGKGVDYQLPDDRDAIQEYERQWREWETAHPDDPTGEIALSKQPAGSGAASPARHVEHNFGPSSSEDTGPLKLQLENSDIRRLKSYASFKRLRPRDIIANLIREHCNV